MLASIKIIFVTKPKTCHMCDWRNRLTLPILFAPSISEVPAQYMTWSSYRDSHGHKLVQLNITFNSIEDKRGDKLITKTDKIRNNSIAFVQTDLDLLCSHILSLEAT